MIALSAVGLFDGAVGVLWPSVRHTFDQPLAALGVVLLAYTGGYFCTSLAGGWLLERVGTGRAMLGVAAGAIAGASGASSLPVPARRSTPATAAQAIARRSRDDVGALSQGVMGC